MKEALDRIERALSDLATDAALEAVKELRAALREIEEQERDAVSAAYDKGYQDGRSSADAEWYYALTELHRIAETLEEANVDRILEA